MQLDTATSLCLMPPKCCRLMGIASAAGCTKLVEVHVELHVELRDDGRSAVVQPLAKGLGGNSAARARKHAQMFSRNVSINVRYFSRASLDADAAAVNSRFGVGGPLPLVLSTLTCRCIATAAAPVEGGLSMHVEGLPAK